MGALPHSVIGFLVIQTAGYVQKPKILPACTCLGLEATLRTMPHLGITEHQTHYSSYPTIALSFFEVHVNCVSIQALRFKAYSVPPYLCLPSLSPVRLWQDSSLSLHFVIHLTLKQIMRWMQMSFYPKQQGQVHQEIA